jgi:hypothetical protein
MKLGWIAMVLGALWFAAPAQAGPGSGDDLLAQVTSGNHPDVVPLTADELADIRGEGTIEKFIELPRLHRSFERVVNLDNGLSLSIVGVAGEGIHISISSPHIP